MLRAAHILREWETNLGKFQIDSQTYATGVVVSPTMTRIAKFGLRAKVRSIQKIDSLDQVYVHQPLLRHESLVCLCQGFTQHGKKKNKGSNSQSAMEFGIPDLPPVKTRV